MANKVEELSAIQRKGEMEFKLAMARSRQSAAHGEQLSDPIYNLMQGGGTTLTNLAKATDNGSSPLLFGGKSKTGM